MNENMHKLVKRTLLSINFEVSESDEVQPHELREFAYHMQERLGVTPAAYWHMMLSEETMTEVLKPHLQDTPPDTPADAPQVVGTPDQAPADPVPPVVDPVAEEPVVDPVVDTPPVADPVAEEPLAEDSTEGEDE